MDYPTDIGAGYVQLTLNYRSVAFNDPAPTNRDFFSLHNDTWQPTLLGGDVLQQAEQQGKLSMETVTELLKVVKTPLGTLFDGIWNQMNDWATTAMQQAVQGVQSNAYDISASFPTSGTLHAGSTSVGGSTVIGLSYSLPGISVTFKTTTSGPFGSGEDPQWTIKFDGELQVNITTPGAPPYTLAPQVNFLAHNATGSGNFFADVSNFSNEIVGALVGYLVGGIEGALVGGVSVWLGDQGNGQLSAVDKTNMPIQVAGLLTPLMDLAGALNALAQQGFVMLGATVDDASDPNPATIHFTLSHPVAQAPILQEVPGPSKGLIHASIGLSTTQVPPGGSLQVVGTGFSAGASSPSIAVQWQDTTIGLNVATATVMGGNTTKSEIQIAATTGPGQAPKSPPAPVSVPKAAGSGPANTYASANLQANAWYALRVREYDFPDAATDYSAWVYAQALSTGQAQLDLKTPKQPVGFALGSASVSAQGGFSTTVTVPAVVPVGAYELVATTANATASMPLAVVAAAKAMIQIVDPRTGIVLPARVVGGESVTVRGDWFGKGIVTLYVDSPAGQKLGSVSIATVIGTREGQLASATATQVAPKPGAIKVAGGLVEGNVAGHAVIAGQTDGSQSNQGSSFTVSFVWPLSAEGSHNIVAQESAGTAPAIEASLAVIAQPATT